jgi:hypothetical protein
MKNTGGFAGMIANNNLMTEAQPAKYPKTSLNPKEARHDTMSKEAVL